MHHCGASVRAGMRVDSSLELFQQRPHFRFGEWLPGANCGVARDRRRHHVLFLPRQALQRSHIQDVYERLGRIIGS